MKKIIIAVSMFIMSVLIGPGTILASDIADAIYRADIRATNSSYTAMKVSVPFTWSAQSLLDGYYINSDFTNLALRDSNGQDIAFMPGWDTNPWMFYINQISQNSVLNYSLYTGGETTMGGKLAYFPDTAGMTVADAASLELGSNFEIELNGLFEDGYSIAKDDAFNISSTSGIISANILSPVSINQEVFSTSYQIYGTNWAAQTFTFTNTTSIAGIQLFLSKLGTLTGNFNYGIYATSGGLPIGDALTSNSIAASSISANNWVSCTFTSPITLTGGVTYAIVTSAPSCNSSNYAAWKYTSSDVYAGGTYCASSNSGTNWTANAGREFGFICSGQEILSVSSSITGEHTIKATLSGGTLNLYIDGVLADSAAFAGSITDNANDWIIGANGSMPYLYYAKITVGGVLKGSWEWEYSDTFTDLSGNGNDATPSFRTTTTDADVSAAIISYNAYNLSALVVSGDDEGIQIIDDDEISDTPAGFFGALDPDRLEFLSPINEIISEAGIPLEFVWYPFIFGGGAAITMISFGVTRKLLPCIIAGGIWTGFLSAALGADLWTVLPFVVVAATELVNRKTVSL